MKHSHLLFITLFLALSCVIGAQNNALQFGGAAPSPDYVRLGANQYNPIFNGLSGFTWEGWIRPSNVGTTSRVFHIGIIDPGTTAFAMEINSNGSLTGYARSVSTDAAQAATTPASTVANNTWYYVAVTASFPSGQKSLKVYLNGTEVAANNSPAFANNVYTQGAAHTHIDLFGAYLPASDPRGFQGLMDEFRFWNYAKTQAQVQADMYKKLVGTETGLLGLWKFDESSGTTADEVTTYNKNGTLVNFPASPWTTGVANLSPVPITQASGISTSPVSNTSQTVLWDNGTGSSRIVLMNTSNSFTDPLNGSNPTADDSWNNAGQQVIYNGNGSSVTVTGLDPLTSYWYRVYEYNGSGIYTIYQLGTATENPIEGDETLPVELSSFTATITSQYFVQLHWVTQSETDALGYMIYRSQNNDLESAIQVSPLINATNTTTQVSYEYTDSEVTPGTWYYWLQSLDLNGNFNFHGPVLATVTSEQGGDAPEIPTSTGISNVYPNPFNPNLNIQYSLNDSQEVSIRIYNTRGQVVYHNNLGTRQAGVHNLNWDAKGLSTGIYLIRMQAGNKLYNSKAVLAK